MRPFLPLLVCALVASVACTTASAAGKKLYRWTDEKGEVHYTDALPPEAADAARDRLNEKGMAVERTERAMTQAHTFKAAELCLQAQARALRIGPPPVTGTLIWRTYWPRARKRDGFEP